MTCVIKHRGSQSQSNNPNICLWSSEGYGVKLTRTTKSSGFRGSLAVPHSGTVRANSASQERHLALRGERDPERGRKVNTCSFTQQPPPASLQAQMLQHRRLHQSHEDAIAYLRDDLLLLGLGLAQTLVEASADDVLQDLPGLPQVRRGRVQDLLKQVICKQTLETSETVGPSSH